MRIGAANSATETVEQSLTYCGTEAGKIEAWRALVQVNLKKRLFFSTNSFKQNSGRPHPSYLGLRPNKGASSGAVQGAPL